MAVTRQKWGKTMADRTDGYHEADKRWIGANLGHCVEGQAQ